MANELVRQRPWNIDEADDEWDRPPVAENPRQGPTYRPQEARNADMDARTAHRAGDGTFAAQREEDAADLRQRRGDWGDVRTWLWIAAMCLGFLAVVAVVYYLPFGRHNQNDGPTPTPSIRVY